MNFIEYLPLSRLFRLNSIGSTPSLSATDE
jgi:hypothetical protein